MEKVGLQIQCSIGTIININEAVIFNKMLTHNHDGILYDETTGQIKITQKGLYYVDWWISIQSTLSNNISFSIFTSDLKVIKGENDNLDERTSGNALIDIRYTPYTIQLINTSKEKVFYSDKTPVKANLTIIQLHEIEVQNGVTGAKGITGPTGAKGITGATGIKGTTGTMGAKGVTGATGIKGTTGTMGAKGVTGATGITGITGIKGITGPMGAKGIIGQIGAKGAKGTTGITGSMGMSGTKGILGITGDTGLKGVTGSTGNTGMVGLTGNTGSSGYTGARGSTGLKGSTGATGITGSIGLKGMTGATGITGTKGEIGITGATGATGATGPMASPNPNPWNSFLVAENTDLNTTLTQAGNNIKLNKEVIKSGSNISLDTNKYEITCERTSQYLVYFKARLSGSGKIALYLNSTKIEGTECVTQAGSGSPSYKHMVSFATILYPQITEPTTVISVKVEGSNLSIGYASIVIIELKQ